MKVSNLLAAAGAILTLSAGAALAAEGWEGDGGGGWLNINSS